MIVLLLHVIGIVALSWAASFGVQLWLQWRQSR
jgi:hypothetical protein